MIDSRVMVDQGALDLSRTLEDGDFQDLVGWGQIVEDEQRKGDISQGSWQLGYMNVNCHRLNVNVNVISFNNALILSLTFSIQV
jgi:hypothetical protein